MAKAIVHDKCVRAIRGGRPHANSDVANGPDRGGRPHANSDVANGPDLPLNCRGAKTLAPYRTMANAIAHDKCVKAFLGAGRLQTVMLQPDPTCPKNAGALESQHPPQHKTQTRYGESHSAR